MPFPKLDLLKLEDEQTQRTVEPILDRVNELSEVRIIDGRLIRSVVLTTSEAPIEHRLGRKVTGYVITKRSAEAVVFGDNLTDKFLHLTASAAVIVDLWVF